MVNTSLKRALSLFLSLLIVFQVGISSVFADGDTGVEGFVTRIYRTIMDREPDPSGLNYWVSGMESGQFTASFVIEYFLSSGEFAAKNCDNAEYVDVLYTTLMGRESDPDGAGFWIGLLDQGYTRKKILFSFINSAEFINICDSYGVTKGNITLSAIDSNPEKVLFVAQMYRSFFNREPDTPGLNSWVNYLVGGHTASQLISNFIVSPEFINRNLSDYDYVACLYRALLGREGTSDEINGWVSTMNAHQSSRLFLAKLISKSPEFSGICSNAGVEVGDITLSENRDLYIGCADFVINTYNSLLGRAPSDDDLNYWVGQLVSASCGKDFINYFLSTQEFKNRNLSNGDFVKAVFSAALGREASDSDVDFYSSYISTNGKDAFVSYIYSTTEFATNCSAVGISTNFHEGWNNTIGGRIYISGGKQLSGWQRIDGKRYYFNPQNNNIAAKGWNYVGGFKYYFNADNSLCEDVRNLVNTPGNYYITVDCVSNMVTIYAKDEYGNFVVPVKAMICSTGAGGATPAGSFTARRLGRWHPLMGDCYGQYCTQINGNILFHSVWYYQDGNPNTQSVKEFRKLGTSCSHGCIRLTVADAKWIYENCAGCTVTVTYGNSSAPFDRPVPPAITAIYGDYGHDPTDIWS